MMTLMPVAHFARCHSGSRNDTVDVSLFAADDESYQVLVRAVTVGRVQAHFSERVRGPVLRYELPHLRALKFVLHEALDGGASCSLRSDATGSCFGSMLARMEINVSYAFLTGFAKRHDSPDTT